MGRGRRAIQQSRLTHNQHRTTTYTRSPSLWITCAVSMHKIMHFYDNSNDKKTASWQSHCSPGTASTDSRGTIHVTGLSNSADPLGSELACDVIMSTQGRNIIASKCVSPARHVCSEQFCLYPEMAPQPAQAPIPLTAQLLILWTHYYWVTMA